MRRFHCFVLMVMTTLCAGTAEAEDNHGSASLPTDPIQISGDVQAIACTDPGLASQNLRALLEDASFMFDGLEYAKSMAKLDMALSVLACTSSSMDRELLVRLYFLRGLVAFYLEPEDEVTAQRYFQKVLNIDPAAAWDNNYAEEPELAFGRAREEINRQQRVNLDFDLDDTVENVFFDCMALEGRVGSQQILPGTHLIQYEVEGQRYSHLVVIGPEGATLGKRVIEVPPSTDQTKGGLSLRLAGLTYGFGAPYLSLGLTGQVRVVKGLEVAAGGHLNLGVYNADDGSRWGMLLPDVFVGARYQFGQSVFQPHIGGALLLAFWTDPSTSDAQVSAGPSFLAGFDLKLGRKTFFMVGADLAYLEGIWLRPHAGLTFRF